MRQMLALFLFLALFIASGVSIAYSILGSSAEEQESSVMITGYQVSPEVLMRDDVGTVTVSVKNMGSEKSINLKEARMLSSDIKVLSDSYFNIGRLGPGESLNLTFTIKATCPDGIYYPEVLLEVEEAENIRFHITVKVDSTPLTIGVKDVPEDIFRGERAKIELFVKNPRPNTATAVKIVAEEKEVIPSEVFIGALSPDELKVASFNFTPQTKGAHILNFKLEFKNGDNLHSVALSVPLNATEKISETQPVTPTPVASPSPEVTPTLAPTPSPSLTPTPMPTLTPAVTRGDFSIIIDPKHVDVKPGDSITFKFTISSIGEFDAPIELNLSVKAPLYNKTYSLPTQYPPYPKTYTYIVGIPEDVPPCTAEGIVTATGGGKTHTDAATVKIPGFEAVFAVAGLLIVAYLLRRKRK